MKGRRVPWKLVALVSVFAVAIGGVATGAIPSADGTINGCYDKRTGAVRVIDTAQSQNCGGKENALSWNQRGPQGPQGPAGQDGQDGAQGPPGEAGGLSTAKVVKLHDEGRTVDNDTWTDVLTANLSAGKYLLFATANSFVTNGSDEGPAKRYLACALSRGEERPNSVASDAIGLDETEADVPARGHNRLTAVLNGATTVPEGGGQARLWCYANGLGGTEANGLGQVGRAQMIVFRVGEYSEGVSPF